MKKNIFYLLGVLSWFFIPSVFAAEKFEVLPDLPDPLAYAVQPAHAATVSGASDIQALGAQSVGHEPSLLSVALSLLFVILLIYVTGIIYLKLNKVGFKTLKKQQGDFAKSQVSVLSTTQLGSNKTLHVVELDGKRMLIGASSGAIQLIKDLGSYNTDSNEEYSHIEIPNIKIPKIEIPKIEIPSINFSKLVTKTHKPIEEFEKDTVSNEDTTSEIQEKEIVEPENTDTENNPEIIIDSLFSQNNEPTSEVEDNNSSEHIVDPDDYVLYKKYLG